VQISVLSIGGGISKAQEHTAVNHIKFSIPVALPETRRGRGPRSEGPTEAIY
jgi:hypothetical protein